MTKWCYYCEEDATTEGMAIQDERDCSCSGSKYICEECHSIGCE